MTPFGTRALVTGAFRGIGLAYAAALAESGCDVVLAHHENTVKAEAERARLERATGRRIHAAETDVGDPIRARRLVDEAITMLGGIDILVSNAGICDFTPFLELSDDDWHRHLAVNLHGGFYVGQQAAKAMVAAGTGGRIVFTTSVGAVRSSPSQTHYCATKGGLRLLAQGMALELGRHGITVNCIAPGWVHTDINDAQSQDAPAVENWLRSHCPAGRLGRPDDLRSALLFLASREAGYVTGSTVAVDGGWGAQL
jgi:NAD(P)-dependent dehydrogenase (short-subunit alcohol dehydrogenase family)